MQIELVFSGEDARIAREEGAAVDVTQRVGSGEAS
jgi:hypothetical protein